MSEKKRGVPEEAAAGAPAWMMSFADMMTNLLCFFILLCAFAKTPQMGFVSDGLDSVRRALMSNGLPGILPSDRLPMDLGADRVLFRPPESILPRLLVEPDGRITDANREALRDVTIEALAQPNDVTLPVPFVFAPGESELTVAHRAVVRELGRHLSSGTWRIRVEGFAFEEGVTGKAAFEIALRRAETVARHLAFAGAIPLTRFEPIGYGPPASRQETDEQQENWGRRIVLIKLLESER